MLFGVTLATFLIFNVVGGDPALQLAGKNASAEQIESLRLELGLNQSLPVQYLEFIKQVAFLDWGESWHTQQNINAMIVSGIGPSLSLTLPAFLISFFLSLLVALISTSIQSSHAAWDRGITIFCLALMSISFLVYIISFQYFLGFQWGWFPINGWDTSWTERWAFLVLPWIISSIVSLGPNVLIFRSVLTDELSNDYVRTAEAKGLNRFQLYTKHILKNAVIPIMTVVTMQIPFLVTGSLLLEAFFGIPGVGGLLIQSIQNSDFPVIKALTVLGSLLYLFFNLMADVLYTFFDPRVELK